LKYYNLHSFQVSPEKAITIQKELKKKICLFKSFSKIETIAGADVGYGQNKMIGGIVVAKLNSGEIIERQYSIQTVDFPYIPGLLTFREGPVLLSAWEKIENEPDVILFDGQGIAHPRRMGIATHLGLFMDKPTIGCAKNKLWGDYFWVGKREGDYSFLKKDNEILGVVLRTRNGVKPIFISPGNKIDILTSLEVVIKCRSKYRLPFPIREAHLWVNILKNQLIKMEKEIRKENNEGRNYLYRK